MSSPKVRVYELAKSTGKSNKEIMDLLENKFDVAVKSHSSSIDQSVADKLLAHLNQKSGAATPKAQPKRVEKISAKQAEEAKAKSAPRKEADKEDGAEDNSILGRFDASRIRVIKKKDIEPEEVKEEKPEKEEKPAPEEKTPAAVAEASPEAAPSEEPEKKVGQVVVPAEGTAKQKEKAREKEAEAAEESDTGLSEAASKYLPDLPGLKKVGEREQPKPAEEARPKPGAPAAEAAPGKLKGKRLKTDKFEEDGPPKGKRLGSKLKRERIREIISSVDDDGSVPFVAGQTPTKRSGARKTKRQLQAERAEERRRLQEAEEELLTAPKITSITEPLTVSELAVKLRLKDTELIKHLFMKGQMVTVNQKLDADYAREIAREFEFELEEEAAAKKSEESKGEQYTGIDTEARRLDQAKYKNLQDRAPVVSIMGHVDHGKTTLLDAIRESHRRIVETEAGGITQSIGAYSVEKNGRKIVFLDTPGHEAFTSMRMRGAQATDIAILVVAADDGVMPQTIEAINHAKAAHIPIIVAVNKIDKEDADPDRVLTGLMDYGLTPEEWGGETLTVKVSALQKEGLEGVLDSILLVSEILELKADPTVPAEGVIVEAQLDKHLGPLATTLVQNGTLKVGDNVIIGSVGGRVRALISDSGERVQEAGPATPVEILGLNGVPKAGEKFEVIPDDKRFKQLLSAAKLRDREQRLSASRKVTTGFASSTDASGHEEQQFNVIVKADTQGSLEAVLDVLNQLSTEEVKVQILHSGTGNITEADVMLASSANAVIVGFNATEESNAEGLAEQQGVTVKMYDIIYHLSEEIEQMMIGKLSPDIQEVEAGKAEVRQIFTVGKSVIAGCYVLDGKVIRNAKARVLREGEEIFEGVMDNLKRFKEDAREVASGYECGISFNKFNDLQEGDVIAVYTVKEVERTSL